MKISDLPQPYRALAELRVKQKPNSGMIGGFEWSLSPENHAFWRDIFIDNGKLPPIPQSSLEELQRLGLWPIAERLPYDEKPLPEGMPNPPDGLVFIGSNQGGPEITIIGSACFFKNEGKWTYNGPSDYWWIGGDSNHPLAAPSHLCNRLQPFKPAEPFTSVRLPDVIPIFTRTEPHTVESYRLAIIEALKSADNLHGASLVEYYPVVKQIKS